MNNKTVPLLFLMCLFTQVVFGQKSDPKAVRIADDVMTAMGGKKVWDNTRHLRWNFFGARELTWDKWTGDVRIDVPKEETVYLVNVNDMTGKVSVKGNEVTDAAELEKAIKKAKSIWINDSYWLVMPFKLQDPGVTLTYEGEKMTEAGANADVLGLTFEDVGDTPQNKYMVFVDKKTHLVNQWAFYGRADDEKPRFTLPWIDYKPYGKLLLSGERGERDLTDIKVMQTVPKAVYTSFDTPAL